jgi:antibiotic biosynthesis monooxygenase (ABM) superfamily enzyme
MVGIEHLVIAVMSHAWLVDDRADDYARIVAQFEDVHRRIPGYRGRRLLLDQHDPRHIVNVRFFDTPSDYDALVAQPDYAEWIAKLSELVEARDPQKSILDVVASLDVDP